MSYDGYVNFDARIDQSQLNKDISTIKKALAGLVVGSGLAVAQIVKWGESFEYSMSKVAATMGNLDKNSDTFKRLEKSARDTAKTSVFSANETAQALNYLAQAGYDAEKAIATLPTLLDYATAGDIDLAKATDQLTQAMSALGMPVQDVTKFSDQLVRTAAATQTNVDLLGNAIVALGASGRIVGNIEELNAAIGILSNNGIQGESAGMALRNMLGSLSSPVAAGSVALQRLGVSAYDAQGNFRGLNTVFTDLQKALSGYTEEARQQFLGDIFNVRDIRSAEALLNSAGDAYTNLMNDIKNSSGAAGKTAKQMADNVRGAWKNLDSALEETAQKIWEKASPKIQKALEKTTDAVNNFSESAVGNKLADAMGQMAESLGDLAVNALPTLVSVFSGLADVLKFIADNFQIITASVIAFKVESIIAATQAKAAMAGFATTTEFAMATVKKALISTGIGLLVVGIGELISRMQNLTTQAEVTDSSFRNVKTALGETDAETNQFAATIDAATQKVYELNNQLKDLELQRFDTTKATDSSLDQKIADVKKEIEIEQAHIASLKAEQAAKDNPGKQKKDGDKTINENLYTAPKDGSYGWVEAGNDFVTAKDGAMGFLNTLIGVHEETGKVNQGLAELAGSTLQQLSSGLGSAAEAMGEAFATGKNPIEAFGKMMVESAMQAYSSVADTLIAWGTLATINPKGAAHMGYTSSMLPLGLTMKLTAGAMKGMLKYADGGVVPGNSKFGDKLMARVNSGEVILNEKQQKAALSQMSNGGVNVNVQIINNTDSQVSTSQDSNGNIKVLIESVVVDTMTNNRGASIMKNVYGVSKVGA